MQARLREVAPRVRLVVFLRDPIERAVSAYDFYLRHGAAPLRPMAQVFRALLAGQDPGCPRVAGIFRQGLYGEQLEVLAETFPREQVHVELSEEMDRDSATVLARVADFLGLGPAPTPLPEARVHPGVYSLPRLRLLRGLTRVLERFDPAPLDAWGRKRSNPLGTTGRRWVGRIDRYLLSPLLPARRPTLPDDLRAELRAWFREDRRRIEAFLGRDLGDWATT